MSILRSALAGNREALADLPRLGRTRQEVAKVASLLPDPQILMGPDASEQEIVRLTESGCLEQFDTIHLATHALADDERPERSVLVLSQVGLPDPLDAAIAGSRIYDGLLSAKEIVRDWKLDADLVTLSGCQTALGRETPGEGFIGLAQAFMQAGARNLLVSMWQVEDEATYRLMVRFYENLTGAYSETRGGRVAKPMPKADALQEAKQWLRRFRDDRGDEPFRHPTYWAGFVLIGAG